MVWTRLLLIFQRLFISEEAISTEITLLTNNILDIGQHKTDINFTQRKLRLGVRHQLQELLPNIFF